MATPIPIPEHHSAVSFASRYLVGAELADLNAPFQIYRAEEMSPWIQVPTAPHRTSFHSLLLLTHGHSETTRGLQHLFTQPDTVLLLSAGQITAIHAISPDVRGFFCLFEPAFVAEALPDAALFPELTFFTFERPALRLLPDESHRLASLLAALHAEWLAGAPPPVLGALLYAALLKIRLRYEQEAARVLTTHNGPEQLTQRFLALLAREAQRLPTVAAYASELAVTPNHLTRCVRRVTGRAASAWVSGTRILEAQLLLRHGRLTVAETADQLGFPDASYFGRFFRQHTGVTPSQYRRQA